MYKFTNNIDYPIRYSPAKKGKREVKETSLKNLNIGYETKGVSTTTQKKILQHCKVLSLLSVPRTVRNAKGYYVTHRTIFITLTLPSTQQHEDVEITKICFQSFLDRCRKLGLLSNYVWRAEKQKNGNIHYHILTDTFANYSLFRNLWLLAIDKLGYVKRFSEKFSAMSYNDYHSQSFNKNKTAQEASRAYAHGVRTKWKFPPSVTVDYIQDEKELQHYLSKYVSKDEACSGNIVKGRVWGASQSVSNSLKELKGNTTLNEFWYNVGTEIMKRKTLVTDYFPICFFSINSLFAWYSDVKETILKAFKTIFTPCQYWQNSIGFIPI